MRSVGERFELIFVTVFTSIAADVFVSFIECELSFCAEPRDGPEEDYTDREYFYGSIQGSRIIRVFRSG